MKASATGVERRSTIWALRRRTAFSSALADVACRRAISRHQRVHRGKREKAGKNGDPHRNPVDAHLAESVAKPRTTVPACRLTAASPLTKRSGSALRAQMRVAYSGCAPVTASGSRRRTRITPTANATAVATACRPIAHVAVKLDRENGCEHYKGEERSWSDERLGQPAEHDVAERLQRRNPNGGEREQRDESQPDQERPKEVTAGIQQEKPTSRRGQQRARARSRTRPGSRAGRSPSARPIFPVPCTRRRCGRGPASARVRPER